MNASSPAEGSPVRSLAGNGVQLSIDARCLVGSGAMASVSLSDEEGIELLEDLRRHLVHRDAISSHFSTDELECLVRTVAETVGVDAMSVSTLLERQIDLAQKAWGHLQRLNEGSDVA